MNNPQAIQTSLTVMQIVLSFGNVCIMFYAFLKFLSKPHDTLEEKVVELEVWKKDIERRLQAGNVRFELQEKANTVTQQALLALIDKEIKDSVSEGKEPPVELQSARRDLYEYLTDRK